MLIRNIYNPIVKTINKDVTIGKALAELLRNRINGYVVVDNDGEVCGVISLQDIAAAVVPSQFRQNINMSAGMYRKGFFHDMCKLIKNKRVKEVMRTSFTTVSLETNIMTVISDFLLNDLYIVPVIENKKLKGIITRSEIKRALADGMNISNDSLYAER